ncbi:MAG: hypothetical protein HN348_09285, partial [Proteobacteria bacterium]|nr:hypothetical protein [Pseudomonadota bacterium]
MLFVLLLVSPTWGGTITMSGTAWKQLQDPEELPEPKPPGPVAVKRYLWLDPREEAVYFKSIWQVEAPRPGWFDSQVVGSGVEVTRATWDGRQTALSSHPDGSRVLEWVEEGAELVVEGLVFGDPTRGVQLELLPTALGRI